MFTRYFTRKTSFEIHFTVNGNNNVKGTFVREQFFLSIYLNESKTLDSVLLLFVFPFKTFGSHFFFLLSWFQQESMSGAALDLSALLCSRTYWAFAKQCPFFPVCLNISLRIKEGLLCHLFSTKATLKRFFLRGFLRNMRVVWNTNWFF